MKVTINKPKVSTGTVGGDYVLLHVPSDNFVRLDSKGQKVWERIEQGEELETVIEEYSKEQGISKEVAAFQVMSFLDELKSADFVSFEVDKQTAPLLDIPLRDTSGNNEPLSISRAVVHETDNLNISLKYFLQQRVKENRTVEQPSMDARLEEIISPSGSVNINNKKIVIAESPSLDLTLQDLTNPTRKGSNKVFAINNVRDNLSLQDVVTLSETSFSARPATARRRVVVIVIVSGDVVIIIIISGGSGPSAGKSRSACKTMCV